jgi:hypothetical protein
MSKLSTENYKKIQDVILCYYREKISNLDSVIRYETGEDTILCAPTGTFYIEETNPGCYIYNLKKNGLLYFDSEDSCYSILGNKISSIADGYIYNIMDILGLRYDVNKEYPGHEFKYALSIGQIRPGKIKSLELYLNFILEENGINVQINFKKYKSKYKPAFKSFYNFVDFTNFVKIV